MGDEALASVSIAGSAMYLLMSMMMGITTEVSVVMSQYYGAGKIDRVKKGVNYAYLMNLACYGIFCPIVFLFGGFLGIYHNVLRSAGDVKVTILMGLSEVITRIGFSFLFNQWFGYYGLWWVSPITWCCATTVGAVRYYSGTWQKKARIQKKKDRYKNLPDISLRG